MTKNGRMCHPLYTQRTLLNSIQFNSMNEFLWFFTNGCLLKRFIFEWKHLCDKHITAVLFWFCRFYLLNTQSSAKLNEITAHCCTLTFLINCVCKQKLMRKVNNMMMWLTEQSTTINVCYEFQRNDENKWAEAVPV